MRVAWLNSATHYGQIPRALHWTSVALLFAMLLSAADLDGLAHGHERIELLNSHISFGVVLFIVMCVRWYLRTRSLNPVDSYSIHRLQRVAAYTVHRSIYVVIITLGLTGVINSLALESPAELLYALPFPRVLDQNGDIATFARSAHILLSYVVYPLFGLHICAALIHQLIGVRDNTTTDP